MFAINVDPNKRKEALYKIEQDRIKFEEEYKLKVLNGYKNDVIRLINELKVEYEIIIKDAYERGDSFCEVLFEDDNLLPRIDKIKAINDHELFEEMFPTFISSIGGYTPFDVDCDYCSGVTFYFKEL